MKVLYTYFRQQPSGGWSRVKRDHGSLQPETEMCISFKPAKTGGGKPGMAFRFKNKTGPCANLIIHLKRVLPERGQSSFYYEPNLKVPDKLGRHVAVVLLSEKALQEACTYCGIAGLWQRRLKQEFKAHTKMKERHEPVLFCNTGWMEHYDGAGKITGGGSYVTSHGFGHEIYNFAPYGDRVYGYVQPRGSVINVKRISNIADNQKITGVTVIWTARNPKGGRYVVGWYKQAAVFRDWQNAPKGAPRMVPGSKKLCGYYITAVSKNTRLLSIDERTLRVPGGKGGMGQSNIWYADGRRAKQFIEKVMSVIEAGPVQEKTNKGKKNSRHARRQVDVEKRKQVELAAMDVVEREFEKRKYRVRDVHQKNLGWDMEAHHPDIGELHLEVKGLSGRQLVVEITPNEYTQMLDRALDYRLCVVIRALTSPKLSIFRYSDEKGAWVDENGHELIIEEQTSAKCSL
jgi:hypothetical protein